MTNWSIIIDLLNELNLSRKRVVVVQVARVYGAEAGRAMLVLVGLHRGPTLNAVVAEKMSVEALHGIPHDQRAA